MPKIRQIEEVEEDEDSEDSEEEDADEELIEEPVKPKFKPKIQVKPEPKEAKRRFGIIAPQTLKIVDTETNEVIGDGEFAVIQALTDILERLERIEVQIGATLQ